MADDEQKKQAAVRAELETRPENTPGSKIEAERAKLEARAAKEANTPDSPPWNRSIKIGVAIATVAFILIILWRFQALISPLIIAAILSYLLQPIISFINTHINLRRNMVVNLVYLSLAVVFISATVVLGLALYRQALNLVQQIPDIIAAAPEFIEDTRRQLAQPIEIGTYSFALPISTEEAIEWRALFMQLRQYIEPAITQVGTSLGTLALRTVEVISWIIFILFVSIYISNDSPRISSVISEAAELPGYRKDAERLWREFGRIWNAYLRGQAILGLVIGTTVATVLGVLGVENALALGLLSGLLEFIPFVGPIIGSGTAILVAIFQSSNYLSLTSIQFAMIVAVAMIIIQQIENNILVPRIVGDALDLNPLVVFVGAIMGSLLAGILGAILAAPVMATIQLVGGYAWRKMFDLDPFPYPEAGDGDDASWAERAWERWQLNRAGISNGDTAGKDKSSRSK